MQKSENGIQHAACINNSDIELSSEPLRLPNFHEALLLNDEKPQSLPLRTPMTFTLKSSSYIEQANKLITLIGNTVGPSASEEYPFNVNKLE